MRVSEQPALRRLDFILALSVTLVGCGGGDPAPPPTTTPPTTVAISASPSGPAFRMARGRR